MKPDMSQLIQEAQKVQEGLQTAQKELANMSVEGVAGVDPALGIVRLHMNGSHFATAGTVQHAKLTEQECKVLAEIMVAAINDGTHKIEGASRLKMKDFIGALGLPLDMQLPDK